MAVVPPLGDTLYVTPTSQCIPRATVTRKRRPRALSSAGTEVDSFPVHGVTLLTARYKFLAFRRLAFIMSLCWNQERGKLAIRLIQNKHGAVLVVPLAS